MRTHTISSLLVTLVVLAFTAPAAAGTWDGTLKLGGIILDEEGDLSTVQETYNIHDGFSLTRILLNGTLSPRSQVRLDLREINLDGRRGDFLYRRHGLLKVTGSFDQHRQVFDADRAVTSERKDMKFGARLTPNRWLTLSGDFGLLDRDGDRLSFPAGTEGVLGTGYENSLRTLGVAAEARKGGRGLAVDYRASEFTDDLNADADRTGKVVSARAHMPCAFYDRWTHLLRAAYGVSELSASGIDYTLTNFQYVGVVRPVDRFQFKYRFDTQRIENQSTDLQTDRFQNVLDAIYFHRYGSVSAGYAYELNDDDRSLTSYNSWRAGATFRHGDAVKAKVRYAGRVKKDEEELTLLKDVEASRFRADLSVKPAEGLTLDAGYNVREREYPDIGVASEGSAVRGGARYELAGWGGLSGTYTFTEDDYDDLAGGFDANSHAVTGRVDFDKIPDLRLSSGVTYLDMGEDLDIEKSILFFEAMYDVLDDWHVEVRYNVYNYDDYILLDRYYTANVVWFNVAYDLHIE